MGNNIKKIVLSVLMTCVAASAAVIFEDDFTSQQFSHQNWMSPQDVPNISTHVSGGSCALNNNDPTYA
ncbi:MAG: hypothetical protein LBB56_03060, partial [Chitinispirillales bacterium]|nr:hypothetical protein [Chitinispirillales bacterium]